MKSTFFVASMATDEEVERFTEVYFDSDSEYEFEGFTDTDVAGHS